MSSSTAAERATRGPTAARERGDARPITVVAAMLANLTIAVAKFVTAAISGSSAMFAEGVHSVVDTTNQGLLLIGARRAKSPADREHPFGYGQEIYFWSLMYSMLMFAIGGGVAIYEGITDIRNPTPLGDPTWSYVVLGVALLAEGTSWLVAVIKVRREGRGRSLLHKVSREKDPAKYIVMGEDSAAMLGVLIAFVGLGLSQWLGDPLPDAIASIVIGGLLALVAVVLTVRTHKLIVGRAADPDMVRSIQEAAASHERVNDAGPPLTFHLGPQEVLVAIDVTFHPEATVEEVAGVIDEIEDAIRERHSNVGHIYVEPQLDRRDIDREQPDE